MRRGGWILCLLMMGVAGVVCGRAESPPPPEVTLKFLPRQAIHYVGQRVTARLSIKFGEAELHSQIRIDGMPDADTVRMGAFRPLESGSPETLVFGADVILLKPGEGIYAPTLSGQMAVRLHSRGFVTRRILPFRATAEPVGLTIQAPPAEGRPADGSGAVGEYRLDAELTPRTCRVGDLLTLKWSLVGRGTADERVRTAYDPGRSFRTYPPRVTSQADGVVSCAQVIIPLSTNVTEAAAFGLSVFNPVRGEYEALSVGPFALSVSPGRAESASTNAPAGWVPQPLPEPSEEAGPAQSGSAGWARFFRRRHGEAARLTVDVAARLAPAAEARVLFDLSAGARVEIRERHGDWVRVLQADAAGWIPGAVLKTEPVAGRPDGRSP